MNKLIQYRRSKKLTQVQVAKAIGVTQAQVSRLEAGSSPSSDLAAKIETFTKGAVPWHSWPAFVKLAPKRRPQTVSGAAT